MPFLDTNSHLTTKPYNLDIKYQSNSESYDQHGFFGTKLTGGQIFLLMVGGFYNKREYSGDDWLVPLLPFEYRLWVVPVQCTPGLTSSLSVLLSLLIIPLQPPPLW